MKLQFTEDESQFTEDESQLSIFLRYKNATRIWNYIGAEKDQE